MASALSVTKHQEQKETFLFVNSLSLLIYFLVWC